MFDSYFHFFSGKGILFYHQKDDKRFKLRGIVMDYAKESLRLHGEWKGKIEMVTRVPVKTKDDLSLAYTPGVAQPCLEIQKDINKSYELTRRWNMAAVITDGSAVLGLGDIGPEAGMPVMEGKCCLLYTSSCRCSLIRTGCGSGVCYSCAAGSGTLPGRRGETFAAVS